MSFKFDVTVLCELIEGKPCLWDKRDPNYQNKIVKENSWEEIFKFFDDGFEAKTSLEKKEIGKKHFLKFVFKYYLIICLLYYACNNLLLTNNLLYEFA